MHKFHVTFVTHGHRSESILDWWYRYRILTPRGQSSKITKCKISPKLFKIKPYFVLPTCINLYVPFHLVPWHLVLDDLEGLISRSKIKSSLRWILFHWDSATITALLYPSWKKKSPTRQKQCSWPWPFVILVHLLSSMPQNMQIH